MFRKKRLLAPLLLLLSACAHDYHYTPEVEGDGATFDQGTVRYAIPAQKPEFEVRLLSFGWVTLPAEAKAGSNPSIQVRAFVTEISPKAKLSDFALFDPKLQTVSYSPGQPELRPLFVRAKASKNDDPKRPGSKTRAFDLFFPVPSGAKSANSIQSFEFHWAMKTGAGILSKQTTRFDRGDSTQQQSQSFYANDPTSSAVLPPGYDGSWGYWIPGLF
jgi:hypothetical protein